MVITRALLAVVIVFSCLKSAQAVLDTSHIDTDRTTGATVDGTIGGSEYNSYSYTGSGTGFGGPLGTGTLYFESDADNIYIGATIAGDLGSNLITLYLDTKDGGFSDDTGMSDVGDAGRNVTSNLTRDVQDNFPIAADFALQFGNGFTNLFELQPTGSSHNFSAPTVSGTGGSGGSGDREVEISLATLGLQPGDEVNFFATLISDSNFTSDEGIPTTGFSGNQGFGLGAVTWGNHSQFVVAVPEPSAFLFGGLLCCVLGVRSWRQR